MKIIKIFICLFVGHKKIERGSEPFFVLARNGQEFNIDVCGRCHKVFAERIK